MDKVVVGQANCKLNDIILTIIQSEDSHMLQQLWKLFARNLGLEENDIASIDAAFDPKREKLDVVVEKILNTWKLQQSRQATIAKLIRALEAAGLKSISDALRIFFKIPLTIQDENEDKKHQVDAKLTPAQTGTSVVRETNLLIDQPDATTLNEQGQSDGGCFGKLAKRPSYPDLWKFERQNLIQIHINPQIVAVDDDHYKLPKENKGRACLINILQFPDSADNRVGAIYDTLNLTNLLTQLGYKVESHHDNEKDFNKTRIKTILDDFKKQCVIDKVASFIVFVGSHGQYGKILLSNKEKADLFNDIVYPMTAVPASFPDWAHIPKIFIVSACRVPPSDMPSQKKIENAVVCYSCLPNKLSRRNETHGTHYVSYLVKEMMSSAYYLDFLGILDQVEDKLWKNVGLQQPNYEPYGGFRNQKLYFNM